MRQRRFRRFAEADAKLRYTIRAAAELDEILTSIDEPSPQGAWHVEGSRAE
jgi:hypothetical protein